MGEVIRFVSKSDRERDRLIRRARAIYDSIFPPSYQSGEQLDKLPVSPAVSYAGAYIGDGYQS